MDAAPDTMQPIAPRLGRRQYVVDRRFQYKYTFLLSGLGALIAAAFGGLMYLAHRDALASLAGGRALPEALARQSATLVWLMVGLTVLMAAALAMFGLLMTHRVAGPAHMLSHYVSVLGRGRYPIMRPLRKGDELREFFDRFEHALESLRVRESEEAEILERAVESLGPLCGATEEAVAIVAELREMARRKREATDRIDVGADGQQSAA